MEKRQMQQIEKLDEKGYLEYTIIPNYRLKQNFITENEITLYKTLKKIAYEMNLTLFTQVSLNRILEVNNRRKQQQLQNRIDRKSIDFVLYDEKVNQIKFCIELDDETHNNENRIERDIFLDKIFSTNIKLIHIKRKNYYKYEEIKKLVEQ